MTQTPSGSEPSKPTRAPHRGAEPLRAGADGTPAAQQAKQPAGEPAKQPAKNPASDGAARATSPAPAEPTDPPVTRAGMVWAAVASALVVFIVLIAFILQNQDYVEVKFFGLEGRVPLGISLLIAAVGGGVLVAIAGAVRIIQLRRAASRQRTARAGQRR